MVKRSRLLMGVLSFIVIVVVVADSGRASGRSRPPRRPSATADQDTAAE